jgi:tetratricopeptide (TPR) repeat protein
MRNLTVKIAVVVILLAAIGFAALRLHSIQKSSALWSQAVDAHNNHQWDTAIGLYQQACAANSDFVKKDYPEAISICFLAKAQEFELAAKWGEAEEMYSKIISVNPEKAIKDDIYLKMAEMQERQNKRAEALATAKKGMELTGGSNETLKKFISRQERKLGK